MVWKVAGRYSSQAIVAVTAGIHKRASATGVSQNSVGWAMEDAGPCRGTRKISPRAQLIEHCSVVFLDPRTIYNPRTTPRYRLARRGGVNGHRGRYSAAKRSGSQ